MVRDTGIVMVLSQASRKRQGSPEQPHTYKKSEVDRIWGIKDYVRVLSKIIFYFLQDGCKQYLDFI